MFPQDQYLKKLDNKYKGKARKSRKTDIYAKDYNEPTSFSQNTSTYTNDNPPRKPKNPKISIHLPGEDPLKSFNTNDP